MKMLSALLGLVVMAAPAWAQTTPGDNPVINAYRQHDGAQTPTRLRVRWDYPFAHIDGYPN